MNELDQLIETSERLDQYKTDFGPGQLNQHTFEVGKDLVITTPHTLDGERAPDWRVRMPLSDWALKQACTKLGTIVWPGGSRAIPYDYIAACPPQLQAKNLQEWVAKAPDNKQWFLRAIDKPSGLDGEDVTTECRAVLTNRYSVIDITETLRWVKQILAEKFEAAAELQLFRPHLTSDILHLKIIFRDVQPENKGPYGIGVYVSTGEIGNRRIEVCPFVMQTACTNSIWWRREGSWQHPHTGESRVLRQEFLYHMVGALEGSKAVLKALLDGENAKLPSFDKILDDICEQQGWGMGIRDDILMGTERNETVTGMVSGITWAAQRLKDSDAAIDMESVAGEFLWNMTAGKQDAHIDIDKVRRV